MEKAKVSKLKNKKKDVIQSEIIQKVEKSEEKSEKSEKNEKNEKFEEKSEKIQNFEEKERIEKEIKESESIKIEKELINDSKRNQTLQQIIFKINVLLSCTEKVDEKLAEILSKYLSPEGIKQILEERDCNNLCGNFLCGNKIEKGEYDSNFFNPSKFKLTKEDILDFFCDVKCFQKFKDFAKFSEKNDFIENLKIHNFYIFYLLNDYFPENFHLKLINKLAEGIIKTNINPNLFNKTKEALDKHFHFNSKNEENHENQENQKNFEDLFKNELNLN